MEDYALGKKRGIFVVFNHLKYSKKYKEIKKPKTRKGTEKLVEAIWKTFSVNLGFESMHDVGKTAAHDFTKDQLIDKLKQVFSRDFTTIGCVFVFILTHGGPDYTLYAQDQRYKFREVFHKAMDSASPTLDGKPIVFIVQACGGLKPDHGVVPGSSAGGESPSPQQVDQQTHDETQQPSLFFLPDYPHVLMAFASPPGYVSYRPWFIPTLCQTIDQYGHKHHFETLLTIAKRAVGDKTTKEIQKRVRVCKQIPISTSTLTKKLRLPPSATTTTHSHQSM